MRVAKRFLELSLQANMRGEYFPVWGTCHGFQTMMMVFGGLPFDGSKLDDFDARNNYMSNVKLTKMGKHTRMVQEWSPWFKDYLETGNHVYFANRHGIHPKPFLENSMLRKMFTLTAVSKDRKGREFVSIIEAKKGLPFYGTQFHPEAVPTLEPLRAFFIEEILKNTRKKQKHLAKTFRQLHHSRHCTAKMKFNHNKFQNIECYFF
jgi:gamma-glutamyl hydrolase